jgi:hypothetical protein
VRKEKRKQLETEMSFERSIPSLQLLALRKIWEENPNFYEKTVAKMHEIFEDLEYVFEQEKKFRESIISQICRSGYVFGGVPRDEINHEIPKDIDCIFLNSNSLSIFLTEGLTSGWIIHEDKKDKTYFGQDYLNCRKIKMIARKKVDIFENPEYSSIFTEMEKLCSTGLIQRYHWIEIKVDIIGFSDLPYHPNPFYYLNIFLDMDVNLLYYKWSDKNLEMRVPLNLSIPQLKRQILRKEFKVFCRTDCFLQEECLAEDGITQECFYRFDTKIKERIQKMLNKGYTCINKTCNNPYCYFAPEELYQKQYKKDIFENELQNFFERQEISKRDNEKIDEILVKLSVPWNLDKKENYTLAFEKRIKSRTIKQEKKMKCLKSLKKRATQRKIKSVL